MNRILSYLRRKDVYLPLFFIGMMTLYSVWRHKSSSVFDIVFATTLSTVLIYASVVGGLVVLAWLVKRVALAYGVPLGKWGSSRSLKAFIAACRRKLARIGGGGQPLAEGRTQFVLGMALGELGTRSTDTVALRQSAEAFRGALPALRAAGKKEKWALTQQNLAVTLLHLSRREIGPESAAAAEAALREAAEVWGRGEQHGGLGRSAICPVCRSCPAWPAGGRNGTAG